MGGRRERPVVAGEALASEPVGRVRRGRCREVASTRRGVASQARRTAGFREEPKTTSPLLRKAVRMSIRGTVAPASAPSPVCRVGCARPIRRGGGM